MKVSELILFWQNTLEHQGDLDVYHYDYSPDFEGYHVDAGWETKVLIGGIEIGNTNGLPSVILFEDTSKNGIDKRVVNYLIHDDEYLEEGDCDEFA